MFSTKKEKVNYVLKCFKYMGANPVDIYVEENKLIRDEVYLNEWLKTTEYVPGKMAWVWNLLRRYTL